MAIKYKFEIGASSYTQEGCYICNFESMIELEKRKNSNPAFLCYVTNLSNNKTFAIEVPKGKGRGFKIKDFRVKFDGIRD